MCLLRSCFGDRCWTAVFSSSTGSVIVANGVQQFPHKQETHQIAIANRATLYRLSRRLSYLICLSFSLLDAYRLPLLIATLLAARFFFFFFGVYTPNQPKAMRRPRSLPLKGSVHPRENGLHKRPSFQAKEMSKEIPPSTATPATGPSPIKVCLHLHALSGPPLTYMNSSATTPLPALP